MPSLEHRPTDYVLLAGPGRSGTTWIGSILNTNPDAAYLFEPFLRHKATPFRAWLDGVDLGDVSGDLEALEALCGRPHIDVHYPPYPGKQHRRAPGAILWAAYHLGKRSRALRPLFERLGRPHQRPKSYVIKDVNLSVEDLNKLCAVTRCRLLTLVRSPYASIASLLRGYRADRFSNPGDDASVAAYQRQLDLAVERAPSLRGRHTRPLHEFSEAATQALRWRIQTEDLLRFHESASDSLLINYDRFQADPRAGAEAVFAHLGWKLHPSTLDVAVNGRRRWSLRASFYSTHRSTVQPAGSWKTYLSAQERAECREVLDGSVALDLWPELEGS